MKKHLLTLLTALLFAVTAKTQTYEPVPFPMDSTIWTELNGNGMLSEFSITNTRFSHNNLTYSELRVISDYNYNKESIMGWIRVDGNQVYYLPKNGNKAYKEKLLYDFNLKVGDKVKTDFKQYMTAYGDFIIVEIEKTVSKIDTIYIGNKLRKRFVFKEDGVKWIEGIGSLSGLVSRFSYTNMSEDKPWINSVIQEGELIYRHPKFSDSQINNYLKTLQRLPTSDAAWSTEQKSNTGEESTFIHHYIDAEIFEYNRYIYHKIYEIDSCNFIDGKKWIGGIRESLGKVYFLPTDITSSNSYNGLNTTYKEYLLYDFTLKTNDSILVDSDIKNGIRILITKIDSTWVGDTKRKRLYLDTPGQDIWIEGIGSNHGLFNNYTFSQETETSPRLNFMGMPGLPFYESETMNTNDCFIDHFKNYYHPMLKENKKWVDGFGSYTCSSEDTIIQQKKYKKLYEPWYTYPDAASEYIGAIREADKKVYIVFRSTEEEHTLYDFTLKEGDSFNGIVRWEDSTWGSELEIEEFTVNRISTEQINQISRKVISFGFYSIIEGIGGVIGFLEPFKPVPICDPHWLEIVIEDNNVIYDQRYLESDIKTNSTNPHYTIRSVNPELIIDFPAGTFDQVDVINMSAKTIDSKRTKGLEQVTFSTGKYEPGVYLVLLQGKDRREVAKVVVTH